MTSIMQKIVKDDLGIEYSILFEQGDIQRPLLMLLTDDIKRFANELNLRQEQREETEND